MKQYATYFFTVLGYLALSMASAVALTLYFHLLWTAIKLTWNIW